MKRALLTVNDVKEFIQEQLIPQGACVGKKELQKRFNLSNYWFYKHLDNGMPWYGTAPHRYFYIAEVMKWARDNNIILKR